MKKILSGLLCVIISFFVIVPVSAAEIPDLKTETYVLMEATTGRVIASSNADTKLHPASVTKVMTLLLIFDALERGDINLTDEVSVSANAAGMGGSQVYLEEGEKQTVDTLIKCICVASANDACVAMAEYISGSEAQFVEKMNEYAGNLGMNNTHFVNCCGLDDDSHMMSALDVAIMSRELIIKHPKIYDYSCIWMDTITHSTKRGEVEFGLSNTNKLIKQYSYATGLKTGSTSKAGCCLSATARKDNIDLIAVVMAAPNSKTRFEDAITLLNYGFGVCKTYEDKKDIGKVNVKGGDRKSIEAEYEKSFRYMFLEEYNRDNIKAKVSIDKELVAPIKKGQIVGNVKYYNNDEYLGSVDIVSKETVKKADIGYYFKKYIHNFL